MGRSERVAYELFMHSLCLCAIGSESGCILAVPRQKKTQYKLANAQPNHALLAHNFNQAISNVNGLPQFAAMLVVRPFLGFRGIPSSRRTVKES